MVIETDFCDNGFHSRLALSENQALTVAIINTAFIPVTISVNIVLLISLIKTKQHLHVPNRFMCALCISDIFVGAVVQVIVTLMFTAFRNISACRLEVAATFLTFLGGHSSGFLVVAVSVDRAIHMKFLQSYGSVMTKSRGHIIMIVCFSLALTVATGYVLAATFEAYALGNTIILICDALAVSSVFTTYMTIYFQVKNHVTNTSLLRVGPALDTNDGKDQGVKRPKYQLTMARTIFYILGAVFVAYIPYVGASLTRCYIVGVRRETPSIYVEFVMYLTYLLVYLNSSLNAIIFLFGNSKCKRWAMSLLVEYGVLNESSVATEKNASAATNNESVDSAL